MNNSFQTEVLEKFFGCDSDERSAGNEIEQSIWLIGIEHGTFKSEIDKTSEDQSYSIDTQLKWSFNMKAIKLLAIVHGYEIKNYKDFAYRYEPFVKGSKGFFKGNIYPYGFNKVSAFTEEAKQKIGLNTKKEYYDWCDKNRIPVMHSWINEYHPKIVIGIGISKKEQFGQIVFGKQVELKEKEFIVNGHTKRFFSFVDGEKKLIVLPHFSGRHGLNSNRSLELAGKYIKDLIR